MVATLFYGLYAFYRLEKVKDDVHAPLGIVFTFLFPLIPLTGILTHYSTRN